MNTHIMQAVGVAFGVAKQHKILIQHTDSQGDFPEVLTHSCAIPEVDKHVA